MEAGCGFNARWALYWCQFSILWVEFSDLARFSTHRGENLFGAGVFGVFSRTLSALPDFTLSCISFKPIENSGTRQQGDNLQAGISQLVFPAEHQEGQHQAEECGMSIK